MFSYSWAILRPGPGLGRSEAKVSLPGASKSCGASTVELAIFFTLVAAILGSVILFLTGTLPQMYAASRLTNVLEGATLVKPRLGALTLNAIRNVNNTVPSLAPADNRGAPPALSLEAKALGDFLELAFPAEHPDPLSCIAIYSMKNYSALDGGSCELTASSVFVELALYPDCPNGTQLQCIVAQAKAILEAKNCDTEEGGHVLLAALYPREGGFLKSPCAVIELGYPRVIDQ
jgi:hypothetical protein